MADFDPNEFVAGFDPGAFTADIEDGGPESFLSPETFRPSPGRKPLANTGPIDKVRRDLDPSRLSAGDSAAAPAMSAMDASSFGLLGKALGFDRDVLSSNPIARAVDESPLGPYIGKQGGAVADRAMEGMERYRRDEPTLSRYTDMPGYYVGPAKAVAEVVGHGLDTLGRAASRTAGGRARAFLDAKGEPLSAPRGPFNESVKPQGTFNPEAPVSGGTFEGMQAGKALEALERIKSRMPAGGASEIETEIARVRAASTAAPDPRIAHAQDALKLKLPGAHGVGAGLLAEGALHYAGHGMHGLGPIALAMLAAKNANPLAGRVLMNASQPKNIARGMGGVPLLLQAALGNRSDGQQ